jgi:hypothetical protein
VRRRERPLIPILAIAIALAGLAPSALAAPRGGGQSAPGKHSKPPRGSQAETQTQPPPQLTDPEQISAGNLAKDLGASGQVDPVAGLGIRNPVCDSLSQIRSRPVRLSCEANGSPESDYPTSNYGFDTFISTGVTHPIGDFTAAFDSILNGIWLGLIFLLKLILELLGLAFGLNPFAEGQTMSRISASVGRIYNEITDPWLSTLIVCGGIWFAYRGLIRRDLASGVGGTLAAVALLVLGLWIVHQPRESVGRLANLSDEVALGTISAPQSGSINRPVGSYAEAMSQTWSRLVEVPFAGLDFSDVNWALSPPPKEAVERADNWFCQDIGALAQIAAYQWLGDPEASKQCAAFARKRYGRPKRLIDLYLRSSPGSPAREALWKLFDGDEETKAKVAAQGGDGALTRLSMLALFAIGLLGAILLLAWLAIRLFTQAAIAFVLLLAAPFALFFPLLGDSGRRAFKTWGLTLLGAVLAKVIYAAFLSIVLLGISILGRVDGHGGSATGFLLSCAFCWAVLLKRTDLIGLLSIGEPEGGAHRGLGLGGFTALTTARRISRGAGDSARGLARRGAEWRRERAALGTEATRETAKGSLQEGARALADHRYREARETVAAHEAGLAEGTGASQRPSPAPSPAAAIRRSSSKNDGDGPSATPAAPGEERYRAAKRLLAGAERNQRRLGVRWSTQDLERFAAEDRELLEHSRDPADHAHRAGYERAQFESLRGPEREHAEAAIEKARRRDLKRVEIASEPPGRIIGRGRLAAERVRQGVEGGGGERRQQLRALRRERRLDQPSSRRNLSRGG